MPAMTAKLMGPLREAPATVAAGMALVLFVIWDTDQAGYPLTHWAPGGLLLFGLLAVTIAIVRVRVDEIVPAARVALGCLAAFTALSFLSILWAPAPGEALEGADRTLLYLIVFALFVCWRGQGVTAALLLVGWVLAMAVVAAFTLFHVDAAAPAALPSLIPGGRLDYPSGYPNANAAQWLMACWPALLLARSRRLAWWLRGSLVAAAVLLADVALLSQSRGSLFATPVMVVAVFALLPGRTRTFAILVPAAAAVAASAPVVLRVGNHLDAGVVIPANVHSATRAIVLASVLAGLLVAIAARLEERRRVSPAAGARIHRAVAAIAIACLLVLLGGGLAAAGNPVSRVRSAWHSFKGGYGENNATGSRLVGGLGSNRYDFYRVALDEFLAHPIVGIGADNFQQQYLRHGRSDETPRYPHSVELRTLSQTGVIGALLALAGLGAALTAAAAAIRRADPLARAVAAAAVAGFGYWVVHGSFDWFWEFAGLGAPAFAMLGLACSLAPGSPRRAGAAPLPALPAATGGSAHPVADRKARGRLRVVALGAGSLLAALAVAAALLGPWLSRLEVQAAAAVWTRAPASAYARLKDASDLDPLRDEAMLVAGSIALRYGDLARARHEFALALGRSPDDSYATLELGAIASEKGEARRARALLEHARTLSPRDPQVLEALNVVRSGGRVNVERVNSLILGRARQT